MPEVAFVMSRREPQPLRELAETLGYELGLQAVASSLYFGAFPVPRPDLVYVLVDPRGYVAAEGTAALPGDAILARTVMLSVDTPSAVASDPHLEVLRRAGSVFAIDQRTVVTLSRLGVRARLVRPGYTRLHDHFDPGRERPIDVTFVGAHTLRRTRYLSRAARVLARLNCRVHIAPEPASGAMSSSLADGRWSLLEQTKVVINLHGGEHNGLEWHRVLDAIHAGAVVVTEHSTGIAPFAAGEHLLVASADSLPFVAEALVRDPERLAAMRAAAYERLSSWVPFALPVAVLRAAIVELVGEPLPLDDSHGRLRPAPARDPAEPEAGAIDPVATTDATGVTPVRLSPDVPQITIVSGLVGTDREDALLATLDSVARGPMRDFELILVAESTDQRLWVVDEWLQAHPSITVRRVSVDPGASLGAARNAGLAAARAPLCLPLDPGMELYPRCLSALSGVLARHRNVSFAYGIQEVTGHPDPFAQAGGDYLLSFLGWDARRLRHGNYIHAPALIRAEDLRAVGGFAEDNRLRGYEDYDLWCRIADRGGRGRLVPQMLARRTESGSSVVLETRRPAPGPHTSALVERAPGLLAGAFTPRQ